MGSVADCAPSRIANASTSVGRSFWRKTKLSSWISRSSVKSTDSSASSSSRQASILFAHRRTTDGETTRAALFRIVTRTGTPLERDLLPILDELLEADVRQ